MFVVRRFSNIYLIDLKVNILADIYNFITILEIGLIDWNIVLFKHVSLLYQQYYIFIIDFLYKYSNLKFGIKLYKLYKF